MSPYLWRTELIDRIQKLEPDEFAPLLTCKKEISSENYEYKIAYDSSFFYGASGSPVFDDHGKLIAMHTCGWIEKKQGLNWFIMEFAIPMAAIYNDCRCKNLNIAKFLFPNVSMDTDWSILRTDGYWNPFCVDYLACMQLM